VYPSRVFISHAIRVALAAVFTERITDLRLNKLVPPIVASAVLVGGATAVLATAPVAPANQQDRTTSSFAALSDDALWGHIDAVAETAVVGLKAADEPRGFWKGQNLVDESERRQATDAVVSQPGVTLLSADDLRPALTIRLKDRSSLKAVRRLRFVEYMEPAAFNAQVLSLGCTGNGGNFDPEGGDVYTGAMDTIDPGDKLPLNFRHAKVREAWARGATGAGATIAVLDTGAFSTQTQLQQPEFSSGMSTGRSVAHLNSSSRGTWDDCNHGTRMASTVAAPRDGRNMVGVAWKANLLSVRHGEDVVIDALESYAVVQGIRAAVNSGARIIAMAFGSGQMEYNNLKHEIEAKHYNRDILFVGAAGTEYCSEGVVFPANMPEVVAATGTTAAGSLHPAACTGEEVDIHTVIEDAFAAGRRTGDLITFGGSSDATAVVAGSAALVWSRYPSWTRDQVRDRLFSTTTRGTCGGQCGGSNGQLNAYAAVGGFERLGIGGPRRVDPGTQYTLSAAPFGDGPFTYRWSTGDTNPSITVTAGPAGTQQTFTLSVTDTTESKTLSHNVTIESAYAPPPPDPVEDCSPLPYCP
jgi:subtilisin family serine protease